MKKSHNIISKEVGEEVTYHVATTSTENRHTFLQGNPAVSTLRSGCEGHTVCRVEKVVYISPTKIVDFITENVNNERFNRIGFFQVYKCFLLSQNYRGLCGVKIVQSTESKEVSRYPLM